MLTKMYKYANNYLLNTYNKIKFRNVLGIHNYVHSENIGILKKLELEYKTYEKCIT